MNMPTSEVLDLAADEIQRRGWRSIWDDATDIDFWGLNGGPVCLEGGIFAVVGNYFDFKREKAYAECPAYAAVADYIEEQTGLERPYYWNDRTGRTQEDVIAVLRAAAAVERVKEAAYAPEKVAA